jgi:hypothetical protein
MSEDPERLLPFSRHEAHPFEELPGAGGSGACSFCGEHRSHILHHPTRIQAACLLRGLDPGAVLGPRRRGGCPA